MNERQMQTVLMYWLMNEKHHELVIPNSTVFFPWEADLASVTKANFAHEYEIKISRADFMRDRDKRWKHQNLEVPFSCYASTPNYFWYATTDGFEITPPDHAGWLIVKKTKSWYAVDVQKEAPRLHSNKLPPDKLTTAARLLSFQLTNEYFAQMAKKVEALI